MMKRTLSVAALALVAVASLSAQGAPAGWKQRLDRSTSASDPDAAGTVKFVSMGTGFHATNPAAAVYWNPANSPTGTYTVKGSFKLIKPSSHPNYYGLVFGGSNLEGPQQEYVYFLVAQNGTFLVKRRNGDGATENVQAKTPNDAIKKPGDDGKSVNALEVRVGADKIDYVVNGQVVHSMPKGSLKTDGIWGARFNHLLEVQIDNLAVTK